ncbi:PREDICTED: uncharacterized protein LOC106118204 [Papilio xuthus]|uniref:Uncharacterized protein LOC106118204 n=1 Tax=Papilio xuthus TaxID=66420 RepID=A0AAJ6ZA33_PAPXU|nr:PREDICTED: uncharacterized protein LOC106118204 [Papilio xuthus]
MEFFGNTMCGPQNYMKDILKEDYHEPMTEIEVKELFKKLSKTYSDKDNRRGLNGFAYGSFERFLDMKKKGVLKPIGPCDMYRLPPTSCYEFGWWLTDTSLTGENWYQVQQRYPQPASPYSLVLDKERKTNKYATLF